MKKFLVAFLLLIAVKQNYAQEVAADAVSTIKNDYELSEKQFADWKSVQSVWNNGEYDKIKFDYKVNMSCKTCNAFYIDVIIKVNASGKMEYYKFINGKKCGRALTKEEELRMMKFFFKYEYPSSLRNTTFKTRLGNEMNCK